MPVFCPKAKFFLGIDPFKKLLVSTLYRSNARRIFSYVGIQKHPFRVKASVAMRNIRNAQNKFSVKSKHEGLYRLIETPHYIKFIYM